MKNQGRALSLAVVLALSLTACGDEGEATEASPEQSSPVEALATSSTPSPSPEPFPTPTPSVSKKSKAEENSKYSPDDLRELSADEFVELPIGDREVLILDMLEYSDEWQSGEFGENFIDGEDDSDLYKYNPLKVASEDNSLEEIIMQSLYMQQLALTQTEDLETSGTFDPDMALKSLSGAYISEEFLTSSATETVSDTRGYELGVYNLPSVGEFRAQFAQKIDVLHDDAESYIKKMTTPDGRDVTVAAAHYEVLLKEDAGKIYPANTRVQFKDKYVFHPDLGRWLIYDTWSAGLAGVN